MQRVVGGLVAVMLAVPMVASAQAAAPKNTSFSVHAGIGIPFGDFGDAVGTGFGVHGSLWYKLTNERLRLRGDVGFDRFSGDNNVSIGGSSFETTATVIPIVGNVVYALGQPKQTSRPYLLGGAGMFVNRSSVSVTALGRTTSSTDTETRLGIQAGGGIEFQLAGFSTYAEAKLVNVFGDGSLTYVPLTFGIKF
jgi:opacity protein-like surface antigen